MTAMETPRQRRGRVNYHAGLAAEGAVKRLYTGSGHRVRADRWRGRGGEIDLIVEGRDGLVFVEVKAARNHATAAERVTPRQVERLFNAGAEFLAGEPAGELTPCRFDVALVDAEGRIDIVENALAA